MTTNPSPNHNAARALHDEHTGIWLNKHSKYRDWLELKTRLLWFHGIPGAGKTVLFSHIVDSISRQHTGKRTTEAFCVYYYCYHGRAQDEAPHFLRWTIDQLVRRSRYVPNEILDCYQLGHEPSVPVLVTAVSSLVSKFQRVYLLIDALDESLDRHNLLDLLLALAKPVFENVSLLAMSRNEVDIRDKIKDSFETISLSNKHVEEDIRTYVHNQLRQHQKLRRFDKSLKEEVEASLAAGAHGMLVT